MDLDPGVNHMGLTTCETIGHCLRVGDYRIRKSKTQLRDGRSVVLQNPAMNMLHNYAGTRQAA